MVVFDGQVKLPVIVHHLARLDAVQCEKLHLTKVLPF